VLRRARDLLLGGVARAERHGHELADDALLDAVAVEPRLVGDGQVVLRPPGESRAQRLAGHRVDLAGRDPHGARVVAVEVQPQGLRLIHREHHAAVLDPLAGHVGGEVVHVPDREEAESGGQRVVAVVVRDAEGPLEPDPQDRVPVHLREAGTALEGLGHGPGAADLAQGARRRSAGSSLRSAIGWCSTPGSARGCVTCGSVTR